MRSLLTILVCLLIAACDQHRDEIAPKHIMQQASAERRYNGNGNGNQTGTTSEWKVIEVYSGDWQVKWDTTFCGWLVMRWNDQNRPSSTPSVEVSPYKMVVEPRQDPYNVECLTNSMAYKYGMNNLFKPSQTYSVRVAWTMRDRDKQVLTIYYSDAVTVHTGTNVCQ